MSLCLRTRASRLVLTAVATVSLSAAVTACSSAGNDSGSSDKNSASGTNTSASRKAGEDNKADAGTSMKNGSASPTGSAEKEDVGQLCGTNDLDFTVGVETQAGGYYLVTAKAKPGITCYLEGKTASVAFGSAPDTHASAAEQGVSDTIKLFGSARAYAGVNPKTSSDNGGKEFEQIIVAVGDSGIDPVSLKLPDTAVVDKPIATNWHANSADAVPFG